MIRDAQAHQGSWGPSVRSGRRSADLKLDEFPVSLFLRPEIQHEHIREQGADELAEFLVRGVGQVAVAVLLRFETEDEAMRATLVLSFRAIVHAVLKARDTGDFLREFLERHLHFCDLLGRRAVLELEGDDVLELAPSQVGGGNINSERGDRAGKQER